MIPLARKSDYLGAVVTLPPSWIGIAEKAARRGESDDTAKSTVEDGYLLKPNPNPMLRSSGLFATAAQVLKESQGPSSNGQGLTGLDYSNDIALTPRTLLDSHAARLHSPQTSFSYPEISVSDAFSLSKPKFDNIIATQQSASNIPGSGISVASTNSKGNGS